MRERVYALFYRREKQYDLFQSARSVFLWRGRAGGRPAVALGAAVSLRAGGVAVFFKYWDFIAGNLNALTGLQLPVLGLPLPIGISFYTFQTMCYTIEV